jgi:DNA N-6-adenine-methyltransferase (Dam)
MAKSQVQFTKDNEYYTPKEFVDRFGKFDYDPATTQEKAKEFGIERYHTIFTDGLSQDWSFYKRIWINPPFTRKHEFLKKAWETYQEVGNEIYILFPIEFITTARFHKLVGGGQDLYS